MIEISIIIPVYNVEVYLEECLSSVCSQTFINYEIVIIDDGSTDSSLSIIKKYAEKDSRIRFFVQENNGISATRNKGLREAKGKYILFVDSDDYILPDTLLCLWECAQKTDSDIVIGNVWAFYNDDHNNKDDIFKRPKWIDEDDVISGEALYAQLMSTYSFPPLVYLYFSKRSYLIDNNIWMNEEVVHEDELWTIQVICKAKRAKAIDYFYYYYRQRVGSFMHSNNLPERIKSMLTISQELTDFIHRHQRFASLENLNWIYVRIFWMYLQTTYMFDKLSIIDDSYFIYYRTLLIKMFSSLNNQQQQDSLEYYNTATLKLMFLEKFLKRKNDTIKNPLKFKSI
ncbi:MAG TPA: glycosyltransferase [Dysgonomonas sp.]|uniref:glycosyltransferase family 2 protein n=1 Tax=Dysgonomonas TaxID=156973 RepID=UPI0025BDAC1E|nr:MULTISPECIES: glycosyltransferase [Dysgonomonas]MBS5908300.1 glycosyltransferase [Dysgonomonas mossii]HML64706.1 glycosyltransferase [Dysgonomonas sp.]